jgi:8-amino-7-oxononanoate synthase
MSGGMSSLDDMAHDRLQALRAQSLTREVVETALAPGQRAHRQGRDYVSFSSNDYLGLAHDRRVVAAAAAALAQHGAGAGASRLVTGNHPEFAALERDIAAWKGTEAALVFGSGYLANVGAIPVLADQGDLILIDELAHACQIAGTRLSKARTVIYRHNDMSHLTELLRSQRSGARHCLIVTEGVFSMDGDLAPLPEIMQLSHQYGAWSLVDDAHALGVIGAGRGSAHHWGALPDVQMGTLSKAAGSYGGYIAASRPVVDLLTSRCASFIFATGLPPASAAAARAALQIMANEPDLCQRPVRLAQIFAARALLPEPSSCIVPVVFGAADAALSASAQLESEGFLAAAIRPPTVPEGTSRIRFTFCADHAEDDVLRLASLVRASRTTGKAA